MSEDSYNFESLDADPRMVAQVSPRLAETLLQLRNRRVEDLREDLAILETRIQTAQDALKKLDVDRRQAQYTLDDAVADIGFLHERLEKLRERNDKP